jgi:bacterioferritin-associated ferredoxin
MYICICKSVTDKQIRRAAANGIDNLYELREALGVAAGCGSCADAASSILSEAADSNPSKTAGCHAAAL